MDHLLDVKAMIRIATKEAKKSSFYYRLGAVIVKGKRILSHGWNAISYCDLNNIKHSRHAEMHAIKQLLNKQYGLSSLAGATIYVSRITSTGRTMLAKPCPKCMSLILSVGIKEVIYTTDNSIERLKL